MMILSSDLELVASGNRQRYSYRDASLQDGGWEEYWYDALGRRVFTRARRERTTSYSSSVSGPLCVGSSNLACRSFTERVWWDGEQSLVEERTPEGTSDASNSGTVGNIHGLTLDEPLAVISTTPSTETRIINYNWRGQGMSSVFPNGAGADNVTGSGTAEIDWPAITQAQTYFTPSLDAASADNTPKKWMGTFVANGQGTTGMLYRRNRYFDPNTGRFTQEDPIGIAGGVNAYGFAKGDPVNFSDPFGLITCPPDCDDDTDTSLPERDLKFRRKLEDAGKRAEANTWLTLAALGGVRAMLAGGVEAVRVLVAGGEAIEATSSAAKIVFGHGARHLAGTGLEASKVESLIRSEVTQSVKNASETGNFWGRIIVDGQKVQYHAFTLPSGIINIGTYYPLY